MSKPFGDPVDPVPLEQGKVWASQYQAEFTKPGNTPRFCADGHSMIQWWDPKMTACPLCEAREALVDEEERQRDE